MADRTYHCGASVVTLPASRAEVQAATFMKLKDAAADLQCHEKTLKRKSETGQYPRLHKGLGRALLVVRSEHEQFRDQMLRKLER